MLPTYNRAYTVVMETTNTTPKTRCNVCRKNRPWDQVTTTNRRRSGSYNRGGSACETNVCKSCCEEAIYWTRQNRFNGEAVVSANTLDGEITWSTACDHFGLEWRSDLPKNASDQQARFTFVRNAEGKMIQIVKG